MRHHRVVRLASVFIIAGGHQPAQLGGRMVLGMMEKIIGDQTERAVLSNQR